MNELLKRFGRDRMLAAELATATLLLNFLALADTVFVMIVLRRYVAHGFDGTLIILTLGTLVAIALQFALRRVRETLAAGVDAARERRDALRAAEALVRAQASALDGFSDERAHDIVGELEKARAAFEPASVCNMFDAPFFLLFTLAVWFLSPTLAGVVLVGSALTLVFGLRSLGTSRKAMAALDDAERENRALIGSASHAVDAVRTFLGGRTCRRLWEEQHGRIFALRRALAGVSGRSQSVAQGVGVFARVGVYAVGAKLVVEGHLSTAALIGASMLASYAIQKVSLFVQAAERLERSAEASRRVESFIALPREREGGAVPEAYAGRLRFEDVAFAWEEGARPVFPPVSFELNPGEVLVVVGSNGSGKTTLVRLALGLLRPTTGTIRVDDSPLDGTDLVWWRRQLCYMPQEAAFLDGTIRENLTMATDAPAEFDLQPVIAAAGLREFLDRSEKGVEERIEGGGRNLPLGIRRRLALARGLATGGRVVVLDEPTEGLDAQGMRTVFEALNALAREGRSILVVSHDRNIVRGANYVLDLDAGGEAKPVRVVASSAEAQPSVTATASDQGGAA
ncbi:ATP-binding cassette subfamily C protein LapB [Desulfobaculum xiamenense]|uniref:ATP-binding cassette subfamily C protein LapB n=1 Tax=Desulfobaculum xiamenense TaxID=995050 RepID=A0A846QGM2_9BACT|nr:ATP-binding cassette domain-containing protein [Desulfobaculum xiamenense]NJB67438.1 ATP-binding cassette subfamily C protein LapB [Desulfobaculum xiamenense]